MRVSLHPRLALNPPGAGVPTETMPPTPEVKETLRGTLLVLLQNPWCQGSYARTQEGTKVSQPDRPDAYAFCLMGAVIKALPSLDGFLAVRGHLDSVLRTAPSVWNDNPQRTQEEVLSLLYQEAGIVAPPKPYRTDDPLWVATEVSRVRDGA